MLFATEFPVTLCLALALAATQQALAVNDWSVPCTQGQCSWDLPADSGASGTVQIVSLRFIFAHSIAFSEPSLTVICLLHLVEFSQCDFGHYQRHWVANHYELRPEYPKARNPARVPEQQPGL